LNLGVAREFKFGSKFDLHRRVDLENTFDGQAQYVDPEQTS
jgi:hypothetical protein